ncbi:MAG: DUF177 domain-containing protein [Chloroflexi bacterium]|nr:DUF177 domain-containing protein [Chloroflexota bacterium]
MAVQPIVIDTQINIAHLLKGSVGSAQRVRVVVSVLSLGEAREARSLAGDLKLTRLNHGLLVVGDLTATVELTCMRCLEEYMQPIAFRLEEEFRPTIDLASGAAVAYHGRDAEGDYFLIGDDHVLDLTEALRQAAWLAAPMVPRCRDDCPGLAPANEGTAAGTAAVDDRLAVLSRLLDPADDHQSPSSPLVR